MKIVLSNAVRNTSAAKGVKAIGGGLERTAALSKIASAEVTIALSSEVRRVTREKPVRAIGGGL